MRSNRRNFGYGGSRVGVAWKRERETVREDRVVMGKGGSEPCCDEKLVRVDGDRWSLLECVCLSFV